MDGTPRLKSDLAEGRLTQCPVVVIGGPQTLCPAQEQQIVFSAWLTATPCQQGVAVSNVKMKVERLEQGNATIEILQVNQPAGASLIR